MGIEDLIGKILTSIEISEDKRRIVWSCSDGSKYLMYHEQDCCESVTLEDVCGDLNNLLGAPILVAAESTNHDNPRDSEDESHTWTFYKFATIKGYVDLRWYGESNGFYSERVDFQLIEEKDDYYE